MILCRKCRIEKDELQFSYRNKSKKVRHTHCKECLKIKTREHYESNKDEYKLRVKKWIENNKEQRKRNAHNSYALNKGYKRCECCSIIKLNQFIENCPEGCEVDHIKTIRQQGKTSGPSFPSALIIMDRRAL